MIINLRSQVIKNSFLNLTSRLIVLLVSTVFIAYIARKLNRAELGIFALLSILQSLMGTASGLGLATSAIRLVPELKAKNETDHISDIIKITVIFTFILSIGFFLIGIKIDTILSYLFLKSSDFSPFIDWILWVVLFYSLLDRIIILQQSLQNFFELATLSAGTNILQRILAVIFLELGYGLKGILAGFLIGALIGAILGILSLKEHLFNKYNGYSAKKHILFSLPYYGQGWSGFMFSQADQSLVAMLFNPEILAVYFLAKKISSLITMAYESLLEPIIPKLAEFKASGMETFKRNVLKINNIFSLLLLMGIIFVILNSRSLLLLIGGQQYSQDYLLLSVLSISIYFYGIYSLKSLGIFLLKRPREMLKISILVGIANLISGAILGSFWGLTAFAWSQSIGFLLAILLMNKYKLFDYNWRTELIYIFAVLTFFIFGYIVNKYFLANEKNFVQSPAFYISNVVFAVVAAFVFLKINKHSVYMERTTL